MEKTAAANETIKKLMAEWLTAFRDGQYGLANYLMARIVAIQDADRTRIRTELRAAVTEIGTET